MLSNHASLEFYLRVCIRLFLYDTGIDLLGYLDLVLQPRLRNFHPPFPFDPVTERWSPSGPCPGQLSEGCLRRSHTVGPMGPLLGHGAWLATLLTLVHQNLGCGRLEESRDVELEWTWSCSQKAKKDQKRSKRCCLDLFGNNKILGGWTKRKINGYITFCVTLDVRERSRLWVGNNAIICHMIFLRKTED